MEEVGLFKLYGIWAIGEFFVSDCPCHTLTLPCAKFVATLPYID